MMRRTVTGFPSRHRSSTYSREAQEDHGVDEGRVASGQIPVIPAVTLSLPRDSAINDGTAAIFGIALFRTNPHSPT
jgi:hypothetical protein